MVTIRATFNCSPLIATIYLVMNPSENVTKAPEMLPQNRPEAVSAGATSGSPEKLPNGELQHTGGVPQPTAQVVMQQLPPIAPVPQAAAQTAAIDAPLVAADDEVIEQEWVQKAKKIVSETKNDPYTQEREVGKLQADYIKKRYGKEIKLTSD